MNRWEQARLTEKRKERREFLNQLPYLCRLSGIVEPQPESLFPLLPAYRGAEAPLRRALGRWHRPSPRGNLLSFPLVGHSTLVSWSLLWLGLIPRTPFGFGSALPHPCGVSWYPLSPAAWIHLLAPAISFCCRPALRNILLPSHIGHYQHFTSPS